LDVKSAVLHLDEDCESVCNGDEELLSEYSTTTSCSSVAYEDGRLFGDDPDVEGDVSFLLEFLL
jgi:hypothetical protein